MLGRSRGLEFDDVLRQSHHERTREQTDRASCAFELAQEHLDDIGLGTENHSSTRRVVRFEHPRCSSTACRRSHTAIDVDLKTQNLCEPIERHSPSSQHRRLRASEVHDGGLDANATGSTVEDQIDVVAEIDDA